MSNFINYKHQDVIDLLAPIYDEWGQIEPSAGDILADVDGRIKDWLWSHFTGDVLDSIFFGIRFKEDKVNILSSDFVVPDIYLVPYTQELMDGYTWSEHWAARHFNPIETDADNAFKRGE